MILIINKLLKILGAQSYRTAGNAGLKYATWGISLLVDTQEAKPGAATVKHINATLRGALSQAHRWQVVHQNAAKLITLPRSVRYEPTILTSDQAKELLEFLRDHRHEALFTAALTLGLRRGES